MTAAPTLPTAMSAPTVSPYCSAPQTASLPLPLTSRLAEGRSRSRPRTSTATATQIAVANADSNSLSLLIGRGDGRFVRTDIATGSLLSPRGICAADLNADGKPDLVYSAYGGDAVQVLVGNGAGGFAPGAKSRGVCRKATGR